MMLVAVPGASTTFISRVPFAVDEHPADEMIKAIKSIKLIMVRFIFFVPIYRGSGLRGENCQRPNHDEINGKEDIQDFRRKEHDNPGNEGDGTDDHRSRH